MAMARPSRWPNWIKVGIPAIGLPLLVTGLTALPGDVPPVTAALAYVLVVTGAAAIGGWIGGLAASLLSFLALNFFFTPPVGTFNVGKSEDLVALVVFLLVSALVGGLLSRAIAQRSRAERREREARLLQLVGARLLWGDPIEEVLDRFGRSIAEVAPLERYEATSDAGEIVSEIGAAVAPELVREDFPLVVQGDHIGSIRTYTAPGRAVLDQEARHLIRTFASQVALAMEGVRLAAAAREARGEAERSQLQSALLQSVTHDLRTPLASITASVTGLLDREADFGPEERRDLLETIRQEAVRLNRLVGNLLDLSRLRAGALTPSKRPAAIDELVEGVVGRMEPTLRHHTVELNLREDLPEVPMDVVQVDQALTNILENAAKFSPPGSRILVQAARWEDFVQVRIADQGPGIPAQKRSIVFEPFARGEAEGSATGLGLAIAHAVVTAHGGTIRIEEAPGGGTAVILRLPIEDRR
jgi:two-component system, OmpR family, sensor histidine kinase KdpD